MLKFGHNVETQLVKCLLNAFETTNLKRMFKIKVNENAGSNNLCLYRLGI